MRLKTVSVTFVSMLVIGGLAAALALASPKLTSVAKHATVQTGEAKTLKPRCKSGSRVASTGFDNKVKTNENGTVGAFPARTSQSGRTATITAAGTGSPDDSAKTAAFAYCGGPKLKTVQKKAQAPDQGFFKVSATCPKGQTALSGGFFAADLAAGSDLSFHIAPLSSYRASARKWTVRYVAVSPATKRTVRTYAFCADQPPLRSAEKTTKIKPAGGLNVVLRTAKSSCKRSERVVSGGYNSGDSENLQKAVLVLSSFRSSTGTWTTRGFAPPGPDAGVVPKLHVFAYCEPK